MENPVQMKTKRKSKHPKKGEHEKYGIQSVYFVDGEKNSEAKKTFLKWKNPWPATSSKLPPVTKTVVQNCWVPVAYELEFSPIPTGKGPQYLYEVK